MPAIAPLMISVGMRASPAEARANRFASIESFDAPRSNLMLGRLTDTILSAARTMVFSSTRQARQIVIQHHHSAKQGSWTHHGRTLFKARSGVCESPSGPGTQTSKAGHLLGAVGGPRTRIHLRSA